MTDIDIKSMHHKELKTFMDEMREKPFRANQLFSWMHEKCARSYDEMTDLPLSLREKLERIKPLTSLSVNDIRVSENKDTKKYLFALNDGHLIESVWMKYRHGNTVCISTQVGCAMGCAFCASAIGGRVRSLSASEMLEQIYEIRRLTNERVSNTVIMGMGEPFDNYDNLIRFIRLITCEKGFNMSARNITVSTCGIVPKMYEFAEEKLPVTLAVSLHAADNATRMRLMPVAAKYDIHEVVKAAYHYFQVTGRRVTFEYALVAGINNSEKDADGLARLLSGFPCHVNLIPVNNVSEKEFAPPNTEDTINFQNKLEKNKINVTIRREMGSDIDGACGQLRKNRYK